MPNIPGVAKIAVDALARIARSVKKGTDEKEAKRLAAEKKLTASFRSDNRAAAKLKVKKASNAKKKTPAGNPKFEKILPGDSVGKLRGIANAAKAGRK